MILEFGDDFEQLEGVEAQIGHEIAGQRRRNGPATHAFQHVDDAVLDGGRGGLEHQVNTRKNSIRVPRNNSGMMAVHAEEQVVDELERQVIDIIAKKKKLDPAAVTADSTFEQLGLDSLDAADLLFTVEDAFGIIVPDDAVPSMRTVRGVADGIRRLQGQRSEAS